MDVREHNRYAWNRQVEFGNRWTLPVSAEVIAAARQGEWSIILTPIKPVPHDWFPDLLGCDLLCLASGGGQQAPVLAAAGANVVVLDNSPKQLAQDRSVAEREGLEIRTVEGDMADMNMFPENSFDLIVHPVSNVFVPDVRPVWREAYRVLRPGGALLAGIANPVSYMFDEEEAEESGDLIVRHALPYSDLEVLSEEDKERFRRQGLPFEFGHTLEDQIGGQIEAGFLIAGFYEDCYGEDIGDPLSKYMDIFIATRAVKQG